jgi:hypothetical protein
MDWGEILEDGITQHKIALVALTGIKRANSSQLYAL